MSKTRVENMWFGGGLVVVQTAGFICSVFCPVEKPGGFTTQNPQIFRPFFHGFFGRFVSVWRDFLPAFNNPNKNNNKLIKPILLLGGCV